MLLISRPSANARERKRETKRGPNALKTLGRRTKTKLRQPRRWVNSLFKRTRRAQDSRTLSSRLASNPASAASAKAGQAKSRPSLIFCQLGWAMIDHPSGPDAPPQENE